MPFYQRTLKAERTINPDRLDRERKKPKLVAVGARYDLTDSTRTLELHHIQGNPHNEGILLAWLPKERILVEVDVWTPPATPAPPAVNLYENVTRLKLDVARIAALHGRLALPAELRKAVGR